MKKHNCPYLKGSLICTHKSSTLRNNKKKRALCICNNPLRCIYMQSKSKKALRAILIAIGKPFGLEVEDTTKNKKSSQNRFKPILK